VPLVASLENRLVDRLREQIVQEEVHLQDEADMRAGRISASTPTLERVTRVDHARGDRQRLRQPMGWSRSGREPIEFDERDHPADEIGQPVTLHLRLQIRDAVLYGEATACRSIGR